MTFYDKNLETLLSILFFENSFIVVVKISRVDGIRLKCRVIGMKDKMVFPQKYYSTYIPVKQKRKEKKLQDQKCKIDKIKHSV